MVRLPQLFALAALFPLPAMAAEQAIGFTTYLREGPGIAWRSIDEALTGRIVDVAECADGWCRIDLDGAQGFVAQGALIPVPSGGAPTQRCYAARQAGYQAGRGLDICYGAKTN